jgi:beta-glucosidase
LEPEIFTVHWNLGVRVFGFDLVFVEICGSRKVAACAKHYVGDGGTQGGKDEGNTEVSYEELVNIHMKAYPDAIARGVSTIMASYSSWNGVKMHANKFLLTDVLKGQLGFKGFIISDWQGIDRISTPWGVNITNSTELALNAGIDMVSRVLSLLWICH